MTEEQLQEVLAWDEWKITGHALKKGWTNEHRKYILTLKRKNDGREDQWPLVKQIFGDLIPGTDTEKSSPSSPE